MSDAEKAQKLISIFVCKKDLDIENFLKEKAILFEKIGKSRTYFLYDEEDDEDELLQMIKILEEDEIIEPQDHL